MNGTFYKSPNYQEPLNLSTAPIGNVDMEQSYIENILRLNKGRKVNAYVSFPDSTEWKNKIFSGLIEEAGKDHLIIKEVTTGKWYLIRILYLDYVEFMEPINYSHAYSEKTF